MKLQDAHAAETGAAGNWVSIGYIAPGAKTDDNNYSTTVFDYSNKFAGTSNGTTMVQSMNDGWQDAWEAKAKTALNECPISSVWHVQIAKGTSGATIKYYAWPDTTKTSCTSLTANFKAISHD